MSGVRILLVACGVAFGCQTDHHDDQPKNPAAEMAAFSERVRAVDVRMHLRYAASRDIEAAVAVSDLSRAHASAAMIEGLIEPDLLPVWRPYVEAVLAAAHEIAMTPDLGHAARATAELGLQCARCHQASHAPLVFSETPRPAAPGVSAMVDHEWAAMQMWEGLFGPSPERWASGASALASLPINLVAAAPPLVTGDIDDGARVRMLATRAKSAATSEERAQAFGDMLAACAHCHQTLRDR
jgi:cytochrome c553